MDDGFTPEPAPLDQLRERAGEWFASWWALTLAVVALLLTPGTYLLFASSSVSVAVFGSSLAAYLVILGVNVHFNPVTQYVTFRRRLDALGGRAFTSFLVYIPLGWVTLALITLLSRNDFPIFSQLVIRFVVIWPFYVCLVTFCSISGLPCPPPPGGGPTP